MFGSRFRTLAVILVLDMKSSVGLLTTDFTMSTIALLVLTSSSVVKFILIATEDFFFSSKADN